MTVSFPDTAIAAEIARKTVGRTPVAVRRFTTGAQHFVFEAAFVGHAPIVVRLSRLADRRLVAGAAQLSRLLRPLGLKLPALLAESLAPPFPYLVLERLPGRDLGEVIDQLADPQLEAIAREVAAAQAIVAATPSAGRYGYAASPEAAPQESWSAVLAQHLERSRRGIAAAGLFDATPAAAAGRALEALRNEADVQMAVPFLHDTTSKNVIIADNGVCSGIVDVDDLCFGDPRYVLALTHASLLAFYGGRTSYTGHWMALAGHRDDRLFRFYVALFLLDFMAEQGQVFNGNERPSLPAVRERLLQLFTAELRRATG